MALRQKITISLILLLGLWIERIVASECVETTREELQDSVSLEPVLTEKQQKRLEKKMRRDSIRENKRVWFSILGGPSYTPEASFGVGGAMLATFRMNKNDTISQRSFFPIGFNISLNGTFVLAGAGTFYFNENRFRIYTNYGYRNEPANYFGKGYKSIERVEQSDSTTGYHRSSFLFYPRFVWEVYHKLYVGTTLDLNYSKATKINPIMAQDAYFLKYKPRYMNVGLGGLIQYDTRDDIATPHTGMLLGANMRVYGKWLGGDYNYQFLELEYRQFCPVFRPRSTLAWIAKSQLSFGDIPFTELPTFGSPFDLRGYYLGKYRDKSAAYAIVEYRHMFGSSEAYKRGSFWSKTGFVTWVGTGTLGSTPADWNKWKFNYGVGVRIQLQPGKNFRIDVGKEPGTKGMLFYMNMTEAF